MVAVIGLWLTLYFTAQRNLNRLFLWLTQKQKFRNKNSTVQRVALTNLFFSKMLSSSAHRHSSIDLSFEEGFSFLEAERNDDSKQVTKLSKPHWLFEQDDGMNAFLPTSPSQSRTRRLTTDHIPSYTQQTFTSSIASSKRQELGYTSPAIDRSAPLSSPARRIQATPPSFRNDYTTKTFTPPMNRVNIDS